MDNKTKRDNILYLALLCGKYCYCEKRQSCESDVLCWEDDECLSVSLSVMAPVVSGHVVCGSSHHDLRLRCRLHWSSTCRSRRHQERNTSLSVDTWHTRPSGTTVNTLWWSCGNQMCVLLSLVPPSLYFYIYFNFVNFLLLTTKERTFQANTIYILKRIEIT